MEMPPGWGQGEEGGEGREKGRGEGEGEAEWEDPGERGYRQAVRAALQEAVARFGVEGVVCGHVTHAPCLEVGCQEGFSGHLQAQCRRDAAGVPVGLTCGSGLTPILPGGCGTGV